MLQLSQIRSKSAVFEISRRVTVANDPKSDPRQVCGLDTGECTRSKYWLLLTTLPLICQS